MTNLYSIYLEFTLQYITIHHTYQLLYCKGHIQMRSKDSTINVKRKKQQSEENDNICHLLHCITKSENEENDKIAFNTLRIYITIYHIYLLLYCTGHIQMRSNDSTINVETKKTIE